MNKIEPSGSKLTPVRIAKPPSIWLSGVKETHIFGLAQKAFLGLDMDGEFKIALLCSSSSWGGLEMNVLRLAVWLRNFGREVFIYSTPGSQLAREATRVGMTVREIPRKGKYGGIFSARRLASFVRADGVEFVLIQTNRDILISALAKSLSRLPVKLIYMQHMQIGREKKDIVHTWEYSKLDAWISPLKILADRVLAMTKIDPAKMRTVPLGLELERFTSDLPTQETARQELNIPDNELVAGVVGRIDRLKGQDVLIKAAGRVHREGIKLRILIVGDRTRGEGASFADEIDRLAERLGLSDYVTFSPHIERIELAYAAMDVFVLPSHSETYGMVTIEAMASGKPVIATNSGGTPGIVRDGENGLLVPPQDEEALARALLRLIQNRDLADDMATRAKNEVQERYSHLRTVQLLEDVMKDLRAH